MNNEAQVATGRLTVLARVIAAHSDDLTIGTRTPAERAAATVLDALHSALILDETDELARLVKPWLDARLVGAVADLPLDDADREGAIAALGNVAEPTEPTS